MTGGGTGPRSVVYATRPDADAGDEVARKLSQKGVGIIEQQSHAILVTGDKQAIADAIGDKSGWSLSEETVVPPPSMRPEVEK